MLNVCVFFMSIINQAVWFLSCANVPLKSSTESSSKMEYGLKWKEIRWSTMLQPCIWELFPLSSEVFTCCCADVHSESTCSSARCFCIQEDKQRSTQGELRSQPHTAGVLPDKSESADMDQHSCRSSLRFLLQSWRMTSFNLSFCFLLPPSSLIFLPPLSPSSCR